MLFAAANTAACARNAGRQPSFVSVRAYSSSVNTLAPSPSASPAQVGVKFERMEVHGVPQLLGVTPLPVAEHTPPERTEALWRGKWNLCVRRKFTASLVGRTSAVRVALQPGDSVAVALKTRSAMQAAMTERKNRVIRLAGEAHTGPRCARPGVRSASNGGYGLSVSTWGSRGRLVLRVA